MGIERIVYYSVRCDKCRTLLDEYDNTLSKYKVNRAIASKIANENGFIKTESNLWLCPKCADKSCGFA